VLFRSCLAWDEAALDAVGAGQCDPLLWFWESPAHWVVVGYGQSIVREVDVDACRADQIPILRRCTGGGTVVQGPGCLNYAVALPLSLHPDLETITGANAWILSRIRDALQPLVTGQVHIQGHTDLVLQDRKFSGNAQRRRQAALVFHGTFLLHFNLARIPQFLRFPSLQPAYRQHRSHLDFITNLHLDPQAIRTALHHAWAAVPGPAPAEASYRIPDLIASRYGRPEWHASR
jgi:lipoate-protein ligase A